MEFVKRLLVDADMAETRHQLEMEEAQSGSDIAEESYIELMRRAVLPSKIVATGNRVTAMPELYRDLEIYESLGTGKPVIGALDKTHTRGGRVYFRALLDHPVNDIDILTRRQKSLQAMDADAWIPTLRELASYERDVLWMFRYREDETLQALYDMPFFHHWLTRGLNNSSWALVGYNVHRIVLSPLIGILTPVIYFVVPYLVIRIRYGISIPFKMYITLLFRSMSIASNLVQGGGGAGGGGRSSSVRYVSYAFSMLFYFQSVFNSFEISATLRRVCRSLSKRVACVERFFELSDRLQSAHWSEAVASAWFMPDSESSGCGPDPGHGAGGVGGGGGKGSAMDGRRCMEPGSGRAVDDVADPLFSNFGADLRAFRRFDTASAVRHLRRTYVLDALLAATAARKELAATWTTFLEHRNVRSPTLRLRGLWHPVLSKQVAVTNDWTLGSHSRHALLTGPNAGGKSTLLKAVLVSVLLSQTLTFASCTLTAALTPFELISSHLNVPDSHGHESLFEAEMHRSKRNLDALRKLAAAESLGRNRFALIVMDEIFSSTNPVEGIAGAFAVAKHLASYACSMCIISTHFHYLCKLEKATNRGFRNWQMPVADEGNDSRYRLRRGVSKQYVALELLRKSGFDDELIDDAIAVKNDLLDDNKNKDTADDAVAPNEVADAGADPQEKSVCQTGEEGPHDHEKN